MLTSSIFTTRFKGAPISAVNFLLKRLYLRVNIVWHKPCIFSIKNAGFWAKPVSHLNDIDDTARQRMEMLPIDISVYRE